jgi:hypothetical protein
MLGVIEIYRPIFYNNYAIDFFGYKENWLEIKNYFDYLEAIHPKTF